MQRDPGRATEFLLNKNLLVCLCIFKAVPSILEAKEHEGRVFGEIKSTEPLEKHREDLYIEVLIGCVEEFGTYIFFKCFVYG